ncbi:MAG: hypothetical protein PHE97_01040 [Candidatus Omnitrophica bacterium]|nr:hypothetical protein [Candidatus Omnitrophota bacterium]
MRIFYMLFISFLVFANTVLGASTYQFRDYTWGEPRSVIKQRLLKEGRQVTEEQYAIYYREKIFNEDCQVVFLFTPSEQILGSVNLIWNSTETGAKLKDELTKKYGQPVKYNAYTEEYTWPGSSDYDKLCLDYNYGDTRLQYYGGQYFEQYQKELTNVFSAKAGYPEQPQFRPHVIMELDGGRDNHSYKR